ncbi:MAG: YigZ family protein [Defluviitaleaceae bacterium]|nr:YigZ family protein [Defluviitaleaceae bacterium]
MDKYKTIFETYQIEMIEKKSKFISTAIYVDSVQSAEENLKNIKNKYKDATHNVFAYRVISQNRIYEKQSDDGEPSGTAGMPILMVIRGMELFNILIVVTRYYGGTLLGTGGLTKAYGSSAKEVLKEIVEKEIYHLYILKFSYSQMGQLKYEILKDGHILYNTIYGEFVEFFVYIKKEDDEFFIKKISEITQNSVNIEFQKQCYGYIYNDKHFFEQI